MQALRCLVGCVPRGDLPAETHQSVLRLIDGRYLPENAVKDERG